MSVPNMLLTVLMALIASAGFWGCVQLLLTRKGRIAEAARVQADAEKLKQDAVTGETTRRKLIDEIQEAALRTADSRYAHLRDDYDELKDGNKQSRIVIVTLVDVLDSLVFKMRATPDADGNISLCVTAQDFLTARTALTEARQHLR